MQNKELFFNTRFSPRWYPHARKITHKSMHSSLSLRSFPDVAFETVPMFVWLMMVLSLDGSPQPTHWISFLHHPPHRIPPPCPRSPPPHSFLYHFCQVQQTWGCPGGVIQLNTSGHRHWLHCWLGTHSLPYLLVTCSLPYLLVTDSLPYLLVIHWPTSW